MSYSIYQTEGIILRKNDFGEAERLYNIYTQKFGMITATARGVRLLKSKLRYNLDIFSYGNFSLVRGRDIWKIIDAEGSKNIGASNKEYLSLFFRIAVFLLRMVKGEERNDFLWEEIKNLFLGLNKKGILKKEQLGELEILTVSKILKNLGYMENIPASRMEKLAAINKAIKESML